MVNATRRAIASTLVLLAVACGSSAPHASEASEAQNESSGDDGREVCESVMRATRECGEIYVPALLQLRARYDQPPGIRARYEAEGEETLLPIAREEFARDWSEEGIAAHCDRLDQQPPEERAAIVERERSCMSHVGDCLAFVECHMALLESRWSAQTPEPTATD